MRTVYALTCGHHAAVPGPYGATTGRAWCDVCGESVAVTDDRRQLDRYGNRVFATTLALGALVSLAGYLDAAGTILMVTS